jgi:glycosyltransferase involved in cell wall biosynthesis
MGIKIIIPAFLDAGMSSLVLKRCHTSIIVAMKVSVVIPAYNEEKYIKKSLESVLNQKIAADEIIVVNNNSRDRTEEIALKMGAKVVREPKQGMTPARNRGFDTAQYDIIARIDADVIVPTNWIKQIKKGFEKKNYDAFTGPVTFNDLFEKPTSTLPSKIYLESLRVFSRGNRYLMGPNMILKRKMWLKVRSRVNLDDKKVHEDIDLSLKIRKAGGKIGFDPDLIVQISARRIKNHPESFFLEYPARLVKTFWTDRKR